MGEKKLVTFQMAPRKSSRQGMGRRLRWLMAGRKLSYQKLKFLLLSVVKYNHDKELDDDPQLMLGDLKKFQPNIREFSKFSTVSNKSNAILFYI